MAKVDDEQYLVSKKELEKANKEISDLKKKKLELKQGLLKISNKLVLITKCWIEHESLDKLREQKLANAESETLDKVMAEIENKIKIIHQLEMMAQHDILIVHGAEQVADKAHNQLEILNEIKSALLSMKKEAKTE